MSVLSTRYECICTCKLPRRYSSLQYPLYFIIVGWVLICLAYAYLFWQNNPLKHNFETITNQIELINVKPINEYSINQQIVFTNIALVIPSYFNNQTLGYVFRILHNTYASQIDANPEIHNSTQNLPNKLYFPSQIVISMSILPQDYQYIMNMTHICNYYIDHFLNGEHERLKIFYHYNITMNAAKNRNYALSKVNYSIATDYVSCFDMDDIMHPQRIAILYHILNANKNNIDFIFHSFSINKLCKQKDTSLNYVRTFKSLNANFMSEEQLQSLAYSVSDSMYEKDYCIAYYKQAFTGLKPTVFNIECNDENKKIGLIRNRTEFEEFVRFETYYHSALEQITLVNFSMVIQQRCADKKLVRLPIAGKINQVPCDYATTAGGIEAFRNEKAMTRHHNGWPTMTASIAKQLRYNEKWELGGSYRGQDSAFNTDAYRNGAKIFQLGYYLGLYCH